MNVDSVRELYKSDSTARAFFDHAATRRRNRSETSVERTMQNLENNGTTVSRADIIDVVQESPRS